MSPKGKPFATSVLLIDGDDTDRASYVKGLRHSSPDYHILEATDARSGLALYRSQRIDCVVLELSLPDSSAFGVLVTLIPIVRRTNIAVIVLTRIADRGLWELAKKNGAYACYLKKHTSADDLERAIQRAIAFVGLLPKEDRYRPV